MASQKSVGEATELLTRMRSGKSDRDASIALIAEALDKAFDEGFEASDLYRKLNTVLRKEPTRPVDPPPTQPVTVSPETAHG